MTDFIEILLLIYSVVASIAIIIYPFLLSKREKMIVIEEKENTCKRWKSIYNTLMSCIVILIFIFLFIFILKEKIVWIFVPVTVWVILERTNEAYASLSIIRETISSRGSEALSKRESDAIIMLSTALMMLNLYKVPQRIINIAGAISNPIIADWVTIITAILITTLYIFLIGVLVLIPIKAIILLIRKIKREIGSNKIKSFEKHYRDIKGKLVNWEFLSTRLIDGFC